MSTIEHEVIEPEKNLPASPVTPMQMLQMAVEQGADLDKLQKLMDLQERWEANEARKAYVVAMSAFKKDPPEIFKNKHVAYNQVDYHHATLDHITNVISLAMSPHGLSFRWDVDQGESIKVSCVVTHEQGHSERVTLGATADKSGSKNDIQAIGSTITYLQRYTLLAATGLAAKGMDDDGRGAEPLDTITDEQEANILALLTETGTDLDRYLKHIKLGKLSELPAVNYDKVIGALEKSRK